MYREGWGTRDGVKGFMKAAAFAQGRAGRYQQGGAQRQRSSRWADGIHTMAKVRGWEGRVLLRKQQR